MRKTTPQPAPTAADILDRLRDAEQSVIELQGALQAKNLLARLGLAAEYVDDSIEFTDRDGILQYVNPAYERLTGYTRDEAIGKTPAILLRSDAHPADYYEMIWDITAGGEVWRGRMTSRRADGSTFTAECTLSPVLADAGEVVGFMYLRRDVTEKVREEEELRSALSRYALAAAGANDGMWGWDLQTHEVLLSARWRQMLGYEPVDHRGTMDDWLALVHADDRDGLQQELLAHAKGLDAHIECEYRIGHIDGSWRWMRCRGSAERDEDGAALRIAGSQSDITQRKAAELRLRHEALHDALTGLPNRVLFGDRLQQALLRAGRTPDRFVAVLFVDLDRFKNVNDSLGHPVGDALLQEVARRLVRCIRSADSVAHLGGDEFTVLLDGVHGSAEVEEVAARIQEQVLVPVPLGGTDLVVSASIGMAISTEGSRADDLLRDADNAMYRAKAAGRGCAVHFEPTMHAEVVGRVKLEQELRQGIAAGELLLYYQPIVALPSCRVDGFEALVRWNRPGAGIVPPSEFLGVAREAGLMDSLEDWVLQTACDQLARWRQDGALPLDSHIAVNVSPERLVNPALLSRLRQALERTGIPPRALKIEITESSFLKDEFAASAALKQLRQLGIRVCLDDFGTGYSSLSYVHRFPVDVLKIDRSFIAGLPDNASSEAIVRAILGMATGLGLKVVAEGVETDAQLQRLRELGCDAAQGYYLGRPGGLADHLPDEE